MTFELFENGSSVGPASVFDNYTDSFALYNLVDGASISNANRADILRMTFLSPVSGLSFLHYGFGDRTVFKAYGENGDLLETQGSTGGVAAFTFAAAGISRLDALQERDDFAYGIDDLSFARSAVAAIPLPATAPLLAGAIVLLGGAKRRKARRAA